MELRDALSQIADIRQQMAQSQLFRGYRSATTLFTGAVALFAAAVQSALVPNPSRAMGQYLTLWISAAALSIIAVGAEMFWRLRGRAGLLQQQMSIAAVEQFMPSLIAGALLSAVILTFAPEQFWMLPGLWMILFGLGIFASRRLLPRPAAFVGAYYLLAGLLALALGPQVSLSPWMMGAGFGLGQSFAASILYLTLERHHARA